MEGEGCGAGGLHIMWGPSVPDGHLVSRNPNAEWSGPPASWKQPRSALGVGAPVILPQRGYGRGDPQVGTLLPAMPADWLAGWPKALLARRQATA